MVRRRLFWQLYTPLAVFVCASIALAAVVHHSFDEFTLGTIIVIALLLLLPVWWIMRGIVQPLTALEQGVEEIAAGRYGGRHYAESGNEIGRLTRRFDAMSQRLAAEFARLDEDRQQLRTVLSSMVEGVVAVDAEQRILFANERAGLLLEFSASAVLGRRLWEVVRQRSLQEALRGHALA